MTVSAACRPGGRLAAAVAERTETGSVKWINVAVGLAEWAKRTDPSKAPPEDQAASVERVKVLKGAAAPADEAEPGLIEAGARSKHWDARMKEAKYRAFTRQLVSAKEVESKLFGVFTQCKTRLLAIPSRLKQELPHLSIEDVTKCDALIREACEDLAYEASAAEAPAEIEPEGEEPAHRDPDHFPEPLE